MIGGSPARSSPTSGGSEPGTERFSRKVFVGGLPPDIDEGINFLIITLTSEKSKKFVTPNIVSDEITSSFRRFGALVVDWPHKAESKSYFPPKGYAFLLFQVVFPFKFELFNDSFSKFYTMFRTSARSNN